jgi:hypothetical protein
METSPLALVSITRPREDGTYGTFDPVDADRLSEDLRVRCVAAIERYRAEPAAVARTTQSLSTGGRVSRASTAMVFSVSRLQGFNRGQSGRKEPVPTNVRPRTVGSEASPQPSSRHRGSVPFSVKEKGNGLPRHSPRHNGLTWLVPFSIVCWRSQGYRCLLSGDATPMMPQPTFIENSTDPTSFTLVGSELDLVGKHPLA